VVAGRGHVGVDGHQALHVDDRDGVIDQSHQPIEGRQSVTAVEQPALTRAGEVRWELARVGGMRVPRSGVCQRGAAGLRRGAPAPGGRRQGLTGSPGWRDAVPIFSSVCLEGAPNQVENEMSVEMS
jgi:hypothetical protein